MIQRARLRLAVLSAAGLLIAGACGGDSDDSQTSAGAISADTTTSTTTPAPVIPTTAPAPTTTLTAAPPTTMATPAVAPHGAAHAASPAPAAAPAPAPVKIEIASFAFAPSPARSRVGQTVTWTNTDDVAHSIQDNSGSAPAGPSLAKGDSFSITYSKAGTFSYICGIHPSMEGLVEVTR